MKIDCLMGTYGRYSLACEALACFLQQTALSQATMLIFNQHPAPLRFEHPRVRIVNQPPPPGSLRYIRRHMLELADPAADLIHWWDDDDLYLPWHLENCLNYIGDHVAWKPASSWMAMREVTFTREVNFFEGSWIFRADYARAAPLETHPSYIDHPIYLQTLEAGRLANTELEGRRCYIYRWGNNAQHLSGYGGVASEEQQRGHIELWRQRSNDVRADGVLVPADMTLRWRQYLDGTKNLVTPEEWELNRKSVGL